MFEDMMGEEKIETLPAVGRVVRLKKGAMWVELSGFGDGHAAHIAAENRPPAAERLAQYFCHHAAAAAEIERLAGVWKVQDANDFDDPRFGRFRPLFHVVAAVARIVKRGASVFVQKRRVLFLHAAAV